MWKYTVMGENIVPTCTANSREIHGRVALHGLKGNEVIV